MAGTMTHTTVCIAGGGPAGMVLGLLLARSGVDVTVLEKHADFHRDFRGDTVHPSTLEVLDEIGLGERFHQLPHRKASSVVMIANGKSETLVELSQLGIKYPYIAFVPQWDFLDLLAAEARRYRNFRLLMSARAYDLIREGDQVTGVRFRDADGDHELSAVLTVAADGRHSTLREAARLPTRSFGVAMDVLFLRLSRQEADPDETYVIGTQPGETGIVVNRTTYWQLGYNVPKGGYEQLRRAGIEALRGRIATLFPFLADRVDEVADISGVNFLEVQMNRLRRWHRPGLLVIGDAAHAMSPAGGVGINLAIQDAVATANLLTKPLSRAVRSGRPVPERRLHSVQRRRMFPTRFTQGMQRVGQRALVETAAEGRPTRFNAIELVRRFGLLRRMVGRAIVVGVRAEHVG
jgi:2-polyprenyl-6-methoxyphenol hydroxylase-like FAD-dependent oxidoreductase